MLKKGKQQQGDRMMYIYRISVLGQLQLQLHSILVSCLAATLCSSAGQHAGFSWSQDAFYSPGTKHDRRTLTYWDEKRKARDQPYNSSEGIFRWKFFLAFERGGAISSATPSTYLF